VIAAEVPSRDGASHAALDMLGQAHALVKDANDSDTVHACAIDDDVRSDEVGLMRGRQVVPLVAKLRIVANRSKSIVDLVTID